MTEEEKEYCQSVKASIFDALAEQKIGKVKRMQWLHDDQCVCGEKLLNSDPHNEA